MKCIRHPALAHRFTLTGLNLERFLNLMQKQDIPLIGAKRVDGRTLRCECFSADLAQISALADEKGWRMEAVEPLRLTARLLWLKRRPGVPLGIALAFLILVVCSRFVWLVDVRGAGAYQAEIASYLEQSGYTPGRLRNSVNVAQLERELTERYPKIAWFHAYVSGVTLCVDVTHGVPMPDMDTRQTGDVLAQRGGIVESIRVYAGTPRVKAGDVVTKGQVLIEGMERGADEEWVPVQAEGVVMARCWEQYTVQASAYDVHSAETGRETHTLRIRTPFWEQPIESPDYLAYNTYIETVPIAGAFFPIMADRITHREVSLEYRQRERSLALQEAALAALKHLKDKHFADEIIDKWTDYCMIEGEPLAATATVEWLMDIGGTDPP